MELRTYQTGLIDGIRRSFGRGHRAVLAVLPTGGGKTFCFAYVTHGAKGKGLRVLILVHRRELLYQSSRALSALNVEHGKIAPKFFGEIQMVAVASIQTLDQRLKKTQLHYDLIISDEAHHCGAATWKRVLSHFPKAKILGVTATPVRTDGQGLGINSGGIFDDMVIGPQISELIDQGHLVEPKLYSMPLDGTDMTGVKRKDGDFNKKEVAAKMEKPSIYGDAVASYMKVCPGVSTIVFCPSIEFAENIAAKYRESGFRFEVIHGKLDENTREDLIVGLGTGKYQGLVSVDIVSEGTDIPVCSCAQLLRPTESLALYLQQGGRVLRTSPGKDKAYILDHVGNWKRHGFIEDDRDWTLDGVKKKKSRKDEENIIIRQCQKCYHSWEGLSQTCPECGHTKVTESRRIQEIEGELAEITKEEKEAIKKKERANRAWEESFCTTIEDFENLAKSRGYKPGWALHKFDLKQKYKRGAK